MNVLQQWTSSASVRSVLVVTDLDGTIADVSERFDPARLAEGAERALNRLATLREVRVALISGRSAEDTAALCEPLRGVHLFAEHGALIHGDKRSIVKMLMGTQASDMAVLYAGDDGTDEGAYELVHGLPHGFAFHVRSAEYPGPIARVNAIVESPAAWVAVLDRFATTLAASRAHAA